MPEEAVSESGGSSTATESSGPVSHAGQVSSESLVTPEIQAKFDQVFGGKEAAASREAGPGPTAPAKGKGNQPTAGKPAAKPQNRYFAGDPGDDTGDPEDGAQTPPTQQARNLPKSPQPQNNTSNRSRVSNQPPNASGTPNQQQGDEGDDGSPTLNPVLRQAALRAKWEPEVIQQLWAENPELAEKTFSQLHRSQNELSARFAQLGQQPTQQPYNGQPPQPSRGQTMNPTAPVNPADPQAIMQMMAEVYGGPEQFQKLNADWNNAVPALIQPFVERVLMPIQQQLQGAMNFIAGQERQNIAKEAGMWFDGIKTDFGEMYGLGTTTPSQEQLQAKRALTLTADQVRNGARMQGIQMTVSEALERAHLMLAADHYQVIERNRITAQIKRRSSSITARPTQRKTPAVSGTGGTGEEKSIQAAEAAYAAKLAELGIDV